MPPNSAAIPAFLSFFRPKIYLNAIYSLLCGVALDLLTFRGNPDIVLIMLEFNESRHIEERYGHDSGRSLMVDKITQLVGDLQCMLYYSS